MHFIWHSCHQAFELIRGGVVLLGMDWWSSQKEALWLQVVNAASVQSYLKRAFGDQLEVRSCLTC